MRTPHVLVAPVLLLACSPALATHLTGNINGNPGVANHNPPPGSSTLGPNPVVSIHQGNCPWLLPALAVQGFDADGLDNVAGNADDWTVTFGSLSEGSLKVDLYKATIDIRTVPTNSATPDLTFGAFKFNETTVHHVGGATIALTYTPDTTKGDPAKADTHWVQVIHTNRPGAGAQSDTTSFPGFSVYLDNVGNAAGDPYYDHGGTADGTTFVDGPIRPLSITDWEAQVFITTGDLTNRTLKIWDGAWWGFDLVPEPSSAALLGVAVGTTLTRRRKR